jgi:cell division protein FtsA
VVQQRLQPDRPVEERELMAVLGRALRLATYRLRTLAPEPDCPGWHELPVADGQDTGWLLVDATVVALTVDGKRVTDPVGFRGRELGAAVFAALTPKNVVESWKAVAEQLEFATLTLTAAPMALVGSLSDLQGLLLDVGGETTDLTLWQAGKPITLGSLPTGGSALTRSLIRAWDLSTGQAERLKCAYAGRKLTDDDGAKVLDVMSPVLQHWLAGIQSALAQVNEDRLLPQRLYLLGGGSALPEMADALRALVRSGNLSFVRYPKVGQLRPTDVIGVINRTNLGRSQGDVMALALAAWTARQAEPQDRPAQILSELCGGQCSG